MKNYFGFTLTGKKLLPIWLLFYILFVAPYVALIIKMKDIQHGTTPSSMMFIFPLIILLMLVAFFISFYLVKLMIENITYKDKSVTFNGKFSKFVGLIIGGFLLSIITLGIYLAWFIRDLHRFFINNSVYENESFTFQGKGGRLFVIFLLTLVLPMIVLAIIIAQGLMLNTGQTSTTYVFIQQAITVIIMIPYMYYVYKWMVNINYKQYHIQWKTNFWKSCGKLLIEILLIVITFGIYYPMALIKIYAYFTERTIVQSDETKRKFGFDTAHLNDFLFIWGQLLLIIITLGIYYPWAICKIGTRMLSRTYVGS